MNIVILTGGTGSIALQRGLYHALEKNLDGVDIKIIVNAYDNGLSTGAVRRVMNGRILGPSDVRKNQFTRLQLRDPNDPWLKFLDCRFTAESSEAYERCKDEVNQLIGQLQRQERRTDGCRVLFDAINEFFSTPMAATIGYEDFCLANIVYAGLAVAKGNSLRVAATIMAEAMHISDNVLLNDDKSLFLGAVTQHGRRVTDEGEIVSWGNESDPFVDIFFVDPDGNAAMPELCLEAWQAITAADLVILSAGTQWSSLIPTYASRGFRAAIRESSAKVLMVMNRTPDKDSPSQAASDIINVLVPRYFDAGRLHVLIDKNGHPNMHRLNGSALAKIASCFESNLANSADRPDKHDPARLADAIGHVFFREYIDSNFFLFDYDDTLVGRNDNSPKSSQFNLEALVRLNSLTNVGICTGNTVRALRFRSEPAEIGKTPEPTWKPLLIFADGGANAYSYDTRRSVDGGSGPPYFIGCVSPEALLPTAGPHSIGTIIDALRRAGIPAYKIDNRGDAVIAIKPIDYHYRHAVMSLVRNIIIGSDLQVRECGRTTVEIRKPALSKICAVKHLYAEFSKTLTITYVGDECESGNDRDIEQLAMTGSRVKCLHVDGPAKTAFFMSTLIARFQNDANR